MTNRERLLVMNYALSVKEKYERKFLNFSSCLLLVIFSFYVSNLQCKEVSIAHFDSMVGKRNLTSTVPVEGTSVEKAVLEKNQCSYYPWNDSFSGYFFKD
jgi:hypothetical protein